MSGEIVNLNKVRKAKGKVEASAKATSNRVAFGRIKGERAANQAVADKAARTLDGHKRTSPDET